MPGSYYYWIGGSLLVAIVGAAVTHFLREGRKSGEQGLELKSTLGAILHELKDAQASDVLVGAGDSRSWGRLSASGFDELKSKRLATRLSSGLQNNLLTIYGDFYVINSALSKTGRDENLSGLRSFFWRDPAEEAAEPIRERCLQAIKAAIAEIERLLGDGGSES